MKRPRPSGSFASHHETDPQDHQQRLADPRQGMPGYPLRLMIYGFVALALCQLVSRIVHHHGIEFVARENGFIEQSQVLMALMTCLCLFYAASRVSFGRHFLVLCGCLVGYAAARECDSWFEAMFFNDAYKYIAGVPLMVLGLATLYQGRQSILDQATALLQTPALTLFAFAGIYICSVCQVIDHTNLWIEIGTDTNALMTKAGVEEFAEFFGYLVMAFSGIETVSMTRSAGIAVSVHAERIHADSDQPPLRIKAA